MLRELLMMLIMPLAVATRGVVAHAASVGTMGGARVVVGGHTIIVVVV